MFNITILSIGKIKESFYKDGVSEYLKRLHSYARIKEEVLSAESFNSSNKVQAQKREGERILKYLEKNKEKNIFILDEHGKQFTSVDLSKKLSKINNKIIIVIGGSLGFSQDVLDVKYEKISLSNMTFPHEMVKLVLVEQLYRAVMIDMKKTYHY